MKPNEQIVGLLRAIFLEVLAVALILIGYVLSGTVTVILFYAGIVAFFGGLAMGLAYFTRPKDDEK